MSTMSEVFWIPVCFLVVCSAIPLAKRGEDIAQEEPAPDEMKHLPVKSNNAHHVHLSKRSRDHPPRPAHVDNHGSSSPHRHRISLNAEVLAPIEKLNNLTRSLHSDVHNLYRSYEQRTGALTQNNAVANIRRYFLNKLSSPFRNKAFQTADAETKEPEQETHGVPFKIHKPSESKRELKRDKVGRAETSKEILEQERPRRHEGEEDKHSQLKQLRETVSDDGDTLLREQDIVFLLSDTMLKNSTSSMLFAQDIFLEPVTSCQHVTGLYEPRWLRMVVLCPAHWTNTSIRAQCETWYGLKPLTYLDSLTLLPVQDDKGTVYANVYCAQCHSVASIYPWSTSFVCDSETPESVFSVPSASNLASLYTYLSEPNCKREIIPSIPEALQLCDHHDNRGSLFTRNRSPTKLDSGSSSYPVSFNVLWNFDFTGHQHVLFSAGQQVIEEEYIPRCREWETYDPYIKGCRPITCNKDYTLVGNKCIPTSDDSTNTDSITDLSQLRTVDQTAMVSLLVNITYLDFLMMKNQDPDLDLVSQIAEHLNISADRIKNLNITYEMGPMNGSGLQVTTLTEAKYAELFPPLDSGTLAEPNGIGTNPEEGTSDYGSGHAAEDRTNISSEFTGTHLNGVDNKVDNSPTTSELSISKVVNVSSSPTSSRWIDALLASPDGHKLDYIISGGKKLGTQETAWKKNTESRKATEQGKDKKVGMFSSSETSDVSGFVDAVPVSGSSSGWKAVLKKQGKDSGAFVITQSDTLSIYHIQTPENELDIYISTPVNNENERILVETDSPETLNVLNQNMVMRITFVLVPPHDPDSTEEGAQMVLNRIYNSIVESEFSIQVNGNQFDVVDADEIHDQNDDSDTDDFCPWGIMRIVSDDEFTLMVVDNVTMMYLKESNSYIGVGRFDLFVMLSGSNIAEETNVSEIISYAFICDMPRISQVDCNGIDLSPKEYYVAGENRSIIFEEKEYDFNSYRIIDEKTGKVQICVPQSFYNNHETLLPHLVTVDSGCSHDFDGALKAEGYMTLALGRTSTFFLACVLITYLLFSKLRNLPGLNIMTLTFCLLITQIIFAEGILEDTEWLCTGVAVALHYSLLAAHFWMNIMSYDVYRTFSQPTILTNIKERGKYFPRYALYAWGMPLIIVSICIFIDFSDLFENVSIGYGGALGGSSGYLNYSLYNLTDSESDFLNDTSANVTMNAAGSSTHWCWITNPLAALVAFGAPILIIFLVNCIFFTRTILSIRKTAKITRRSVSSRHSNSSLHKMTGRADVMLYVRMSTVMGFTWVFGLSSSILSSFAKPATYPACIIIHLVGILFIIFNTSQGIFIFVAFVCNRRVYGLYKALVLKIKKKLSQKARTQGSISSISSAIAASKTTLTSYTFRSEK